MYELKYRETINMHQKNVLSVSIALYNSDYFQFLHKNFYDLLPKFHFNVVLAMPRMLDR